MPEVTSYNKLVVNMSVERPGAPPLIVIGLPPVGSSAIGLPSQPLVTDSLVPFSASTGPDLSRSFDAKIAEPHNISATVLVSGWL